MDSLKAAIRRVDWFIDRSGKALSWLVLAFVLTMAYEVIARYVFNAPTVWSYDISYMLGGGMIVLGGAYLILHDGHVRIDVVYGRLSTRQRLITDIVLWFVLFLPMVLILLQPSLVPLQGRDTLRLVPGAAGRCLMGAQGPAEAVHRGGRMRDTSLIPPHSSPARGHSCEGRDRCST